jgi:hypothetical protein
VRREHVSLRGRGLRSRVWLPGAASRRVATSALTIAVSLLALLGASPVPLAAAGAPQPDPYPTRAARIVLTPTPDPAPAATMPPTPDTASPVRASKPVVTAGSGSVVSAATTGTSATTTSPHTRQEAPSKGKKTGAEGRPATRTGPVESRSRTAPGPAERQASAPTVPRVAAETDGLRLLPPAIALLALVIASGCLVQLLARSDGGRARV